MQEHTSQLFEDPSLLTLGEASVWATQHLGRKVTPSNISYLVNYGLIKKINDKSNKTLVSISDLKKYYNSWESKRENYFKQRLGDDLNWRLSFEGCKESETTKHVHRLHPYKGKFIPQLVEYFLDDHIDEFKASSCFRPGDIILDPFCGSGTTLVQSNELNMHAVGIDVSSFNAMISNLKLCKISLKELNNAAYKIEKEIESSPVGISARKFESELLEKLSVYNKKHFPSPAFKRQIRKGEIDEKSYGTEHANKFLPVYYRLLKKYNINNTPPGGKGFLDNWHLWPLRQEIEIARTHIQAVSEPDIHDMLCIVLSRTVRSSRATTHSDLATLIKPITEIYYCTKHGKLCKPLFSILGWWRRYAEDTIKRLAEFGKYRTDTKQVCIVGDAREVDIFDALKKQDREFSKLAARHKLRGIFSSPPYVGLINYHEQHAYAYELFSYQRNDKSEIGPLCKGKGKAARNAYVEGITAVLLNCKKYMQKEYEVFLVANDKFDLYPDIAQRSNMAIVKEYRRPVLNRAEGDKGAYAESIFHLKEK